MQLNLQEYLIVYKNGSLLNADCEITAVRIRTIDGHQMWPNINGTTLLFSMKRNSSETIYYEFHREIQPRYG